MTDPNLWARKRERHDDPNIAWSLCNGCPELTVKEWGLKTGGKPRMGQDGKRHHPYYCNRKKEELSRERIYEMAECECPIDRKLPRRRFR